MDLLLFFSRWIIFLPGVIHQNKNWRKMEGFNGWGAGPISNFHYIFHWWPHHMGGGFLVSQSQEAGGYLFLKKPKITVNKKEKEKE